MAATPTPVPPKPPPTGIEKAANDAWLAMAKFPAALLANQKKWKTEASTGQRAKSGCLGVLVFGIAYFFLPLIIILLGEAVILIYALLVTAAWGISVLVTRKRGSP